MTHGTYQTRNPRAICNPLRSIPLLRSASAVFRTVTPRQAAESALAVARDALPRAEAFFRNACAWLGDANRSKASLRRGRQSRAMGQLNRARSQLRQAQKALVAAEMAMLALASDLFQGAA